MGFLNKAFRKGMKKQVAQMPRRGGGFGNLGEAIRRLKNNAAAIWVCQECQVCQV
jgi:hypothetical protein